MKRHGFEGNSLAVFMRQADPLEREIVAGLLQWLRYQHPKDTWTRVENAGAFHNGKPQQVAQVDKESWGMSDIFGCRKGQAIYFEVKRPGEKQTEKQKEFEMKATASGGWYFVVHGYESMVRAFKEILSMEADSEARKTPPGHTPGPTCRCSPILIDKGLDTEYWAHHAI